MKGQSPLSRKCFEAFRAISDRAPEPLTFVAYGEKMEADARRFFEGSGVRVIQAPKMPHV